MSAKSHPGDGSHGKGTKGQRSEFNELFEQNPHVSPVRTASHSERPTTEDAESEK